ncbi:MBL fold metallo-hydrolase [Gloeobacter violaceus]|uniref:Glr2334 protein n=1 Tax=Gloeobacter violaceus (strain ATCC 29082 / PCC 7421) TaxID=251221 RepID=Q7NI50_GLOVI|nr:MBL fold metallo-hydrolase [Gloeobacter violaceus]BAC90275.1 glr2334 [Gloeobacter violaceus PCC 7421]
MKLTRIDLNSWIVEMAGQVILIDPWLVDPLVFGAGWLIELSHVTPPAFTPETLPPVDLLLISQAQPDHCHRPTLERLSRALPAVASPAAARVLRELQFSSVQALTNFEQFRLGNLRVTAVPGAEVQFEQENGYLLRDEGTGETLYYEPHRSTPEIQRRVVGLGSVDVLMMPVVGLQLPLLGEVVMGPESALAMARTVKPDTIVPTTLGEVHTGGIAGQLFKPTGSVEEFTDKLTASGLASRFLHPAPGETLELVFSRR